jgi:hypothetical protein
MPLLPELASQYVRLTCNQNLSLALTGGSSDKQADGTGSSERPLLL